jgi:carbon storage regulator
MIGDDTELTIIDIRGDKVRIGIKAPSHVPVHRKEIYDAIKRENEQAMSLAEPSLASLRPGARRGSPAVKLPSARINQQQDTA